MADIKDLRLPDLGEGLEEGEIVTWHVDAGETVELNQPVVDIETAKAVVAIPAPFAGTVVELAGEPGDTLPVGAVLLRIQPQPSAEPVDEEPRPLVGYGDGQRTAARDRGRRTNQQPDIEATTDGRPLAKPPVRKLAKELGVDLAALAPGSGPDGVITRQDVQAAAPASTRPARRHREAAPASLGFRGRRPGEVEAIKGIRRRIVEKMERSRREIPAASCSCEADLSQLWSQRDELTSWAHDEGFDVRVTPFAVVLRATVLALRRFPTLNARIDRRDGDAGDAGDAGEIHLQEPIHLGFAVDTDRGLVVPNIKDAHERSLLELALELRELAQRARDGSIGPDDLTGGTFTVNNYGAFGNDDAEPIINHPEGAMLGLGAVRLRPWVVDGELAVRHVGRFRLVFDHRICDGGEAGRFVSYVAQLCEAPSRILLHS